MSDLSITAANVKASGNANVQDGKAGATITAGQAIYQEAASKKYKLADNDSGTAEAKSFLGIALNGAGDDQPLKIVTGGPVTLGAVLTAGLSYYLSSTPGGICPFGDLNAGDRIILIGHAISDSVLHVQPFNTGVNVAT